MKVVEGRACEQTCWEATVFEWAAVGSERRNERHLGGLQVPHTLGVRGTLGSPLSSGVGEGQAGRNWALAAP